ncbi:MAG: CvpA family protein [bacterium]
MSDLGSPFWQNVLLYSAAVFLLWEIYAGWRRGLIRGGLHFGAFVVSGLLGMLVGQSVAAVVGIVLPGVAFLAALATGAIVALLTLGICLFLGAVLFKRTSQQPPGLVRWVFGAGGAIFGLLTGLFILWGCLSIIRTSGAMAKSGMASPKAEETFPAAHTLAVLKDSLEMGPLGEMVESIDILPSQAYDNFTRIGQLAKNQDAMMRFLDYPGVQAIVAHPRVQALLQDPVAVQSAENQNVLALIQSRSVLNAVTDPSLQKLVMSLDLEKALDYAMPTKQNPPSPKKTP